MAEDKSYPAALKLIDMGSTDRARLLRFRWINDRMMAQGVALGHITEDNNAEFPMVHITEAGKEFIANNWP